MAPAVKVRLEIEGTPEAIAAVRAFTAQTKAAGKEASASFGGLSAALSGVTKLFAAYQVARVVVQTAQFTAGTVKLAAEQKDLALSLGTTVRNMSALSAVAKGTNTDQGKVTAGLGAMADRIKDLRAGSPEAVKAFRQLGLGAKDFATDDVIVNMAKIGRALDEVARGGSKGAIATEVLGKNGRALLPVFEKLNEVGGLEGATRFAKDLGVLVEPETVALFDKIASTLQEMELRARGVALAFAKGFGPDALVALRDLQRLFVDIKPGAEAFGEVIGVLARGFAELTVHTIAWGTVLTDVLTGQFAKATIDFLKFDDMLKEMRAAEAKVKPVDDTVGAPTSGADAAAARFAKVKPVDDTVGAPTSGADAAAARFAKVKLSAEDARHAASNQHVEALDRLHYQRGEIDLKEYYRRRQALIDEEEKYETKKLNDLRAAASTSAERSIIDIQLVTVAQQRAAKTADLKAELESAQAKAKNFGIELRDNLGKALTEFATNGINQVHSLGEAFRQLGSIIASVVQQLAGQFLVDFITKSLSPKKAATGGLILGPGTGTSDSIPAWLSTGEFVMPANRVAQPGMLSRLEAIRAGMQTPQLLRRNYADGGLVDGPGLGGATSTSVGGQIQIGLDDGLILKAIESPAGQRVLLKVMSKSPRAFGAAIRR